MKHTLTMLHTMKKNLGFYDNPEEAARAYDEAARKYFGEFACINFPRPGERGREHRQRLR